MVILRLDLDPGDPQFLGPCPKVNNSGALSNELHSGCKSFNLNVGVILSTGLGIPNWDKLQSETVTLQPNKAL